MPEITPSEVNTLIKNLNAALITMGLSRMKGAFKFTPKQVGTGFMKQSLVDSGINVPCSQRDIYHLITDWKIWEPCLDVITNIAKNFKWTAEFFDCDQRAMFVKTLADVFLGINSCMTAYGTVYNKDTNAVIGLHYFNLIATSDGKIYLYDVDFHNKGLWLNGNPQIVGNNKYEIIKVEIF